MNTLFLILEVFSVVGTFAAMLGGALRLGPKSLRNVRQQPALFARVLIAVWILVPVLTLSVVKLLGVTGLSATMLLLMSVCPGMPVTLVAARKVHGALATAFVALLLTAATEPLLIPYGARLVSNFVPANLTVTPWHVLGVLVPTMLLPVALGFAVRSKWPRLATRLVPFSDALYAVGVVGSVIIVGTQGLPMLLRVPHEAFVAAIIITLLDAVIGFWAGRPKLENQKAVAFATALGNPALALVVVEVSYPGWAAVAMVSVYLMVRAIAITPFEWWAARHRRALAVRDAHSHSHHAH